MISELAFGRKDYQYPKATQKARDYLSEFYCESISDGGSGFGGTERP